MPPPEPPLQPLWPLLAILWLPSTRTSDLEPGADSSDRLSEWQQELSSLGQAVQGEVTQSCGRIAQIVSHADLADGHRHVVQVRIAQIAAGQDRRQGVAKLLAHPQLPLRRRPFGPAFVQR